MKKKRSVTLIEIMIVIMLIGLIGGALAFNMRGSMDQGRAFKSEQNLSRVENILMLELAQDRAAKEIADNWQMYVKNSPLAGGSNNDCTKDGWKKEFKVKVDGDAISVSSKKLTEYQNRHNAKS